MRCGCYNRKVLICESHYYKAIFNETEANIIIYALELYLPCLAALVGINIHLTFINGVC